MKYIALIMAFAFAVLAQQHSYNPARTAASNFGMLPYMLAQDSGQNPLYYDYCKHAWDAGG
jgi:hypothetical protein